jgi:hypothetical protein
LSQGKDSVAPRIREINASENRGARKPTNES